VLWKGGDSSDEQVKVCDMEFCIKHAIVLPFKSVYLLMLIKKAMYRYRQILCNWFLS
jgi:hypothetical protein